jgi:hypothetical protein
MKIHTNPLCLWDVDPEGAVMTGWETGCGRVVYLEIDAPAPDRCPHCQRTTTTTTTED